MTDPHDCTLLSLFVGGYLILSSRLGPHVQWLPLWDVLWNVLDVKGCGAGPARLTGAHGTYTGDHLKGN